MPNQFNLENGQRAERKLLITVAQWDDISGNIYAIVPKKPYDWTTNYSNYYTRSGSAPNYVYTALQSATTWSDNTYYKKVFREILGTRTEDSSIEYNADVQTMTDILGINYTDVNRTQPQQDFNPFLILGGSKLGAMLNDIRRRNGLSELAGFTMYVITAFIHTGAGTAQSPYLYETERHLGCTISFAGIGGDSNVNFPITVYFSNVVTLGTVNKLSNDFEFTPDVSV